MRKATVPSAWVKPDLSSRRVMRTSARGGTANSPRTTATMKAVERKGISWLAAPISMGTANESVSRVYASVVSHSRLCLMNTRSGRAISPVCSCGPMASARATPVAKRCPGSFRRHRSSAVATRGGAWGAAESTVGGGSVTCLTRMAAGESAVNGTVPESA